jgi:hypothetical protein
MLHDGSELDRDAQPASPWTRAGGIRPAINPLPIRTEAAQRPSPRRLRRIVDQWLTVGHSSLLARIVVLRHGGHQRPVIARGSKHLRFRYLSTKTGTIQLGEGKGEAFLAEYNEVSAEVFDYECHPYEVHVVRGGSTQRYRPDAVRQLIDGTIELIEVKRSPDDLHDPEYRELLAVVKEVVRLCGWTFRILDLEDVFGPRPHGNPRALPERVRNVCALLGRRTMELSPLEDRTAGRIVSRGLPLAWHELRQRLAPADPLRGDAVIERLLAGGLLMADLDLRFTSRTILTPRRPVVATSGIRL